MRKMSRINSFDIATSVSIIFYNTVLGEKKRTMHKKRLHKGAEAKFKLKITWSWPASCSVRNMTTD